MMDPKNQALSSIIALAAEVLRSRRQDKRARRRGLDVLYVRG